jgi:hypothetical protein
MSIPRGRLRFSADQVIVEDADGNALADLSYCVWENGAQLDYRNDLPCWVVKFIPDLGPDSDPLRRTLL